MRIEHGDCLEVMARMAEEGLQVDSIVTDPPYHLTSIVKRFGAEDSKPVQAGVYRRSTAGFMGKQWDGGDVAFQAETWRLAYALLKPGGHLIAFGGTRTYHRLACAIEDAGFEIRDQLQWLFGSGFPKSHNAAVAIAKQLNPDWQTGDPLPAQAEEWSGYGTALKPASEPIVLARKPLSEKSVAANVLKHGTGAVNVDGCRVHADDAQGGSYTVKRLKPGATLEKTGGNWRPDDGIEYNGEMKPGRWPANVVHDGSDEVLEAFAAFGESGSSLRTSRDHQSGIMGWQAGNKPGHPDAGTAARFFYSAKADASDRLGSKHPTVKPVDLMRWLVRLVTPLGGTVLDPFAGSGTTGMACLAEGFQAILIEREAEYVADIRRRLEHVSGGDTPLFAEVGP